MVLQILAEHGALVQGLARAHLEGGHEAARVDAQEGGGLVVGVYFYFKKGGKF